MKLSIETNKKSEELILYFSHHFSKLLIKELLLIYSNEEEIYNILLKNYNEILKNKNTFEYKELVGTDKSFEDKIFSLLLHCERENKFVYYSTILKLAKNKKFEYLKLFVLNDYKINFSESFNFNSKILFEDKDARYIIQLLNQAKEMELIKTTPRVTDFLLKEEKGTEIKVEDKAGNFISYLLNDIENIEYILFEDTDEYLNNLNIHNNNFKKDYKKIILSNDFQEYIRKDEDFGSCEIQDFEDYIINYMEEREEISISKEIIEKIKKEKIKDAYYTKESVQAISVEEESLY